MITKAGDRVITIGICDDQQTSVNIIEELVSKYFNARKPETEYLVETFNDANKILDYIQKNRGFDILLLDVYMPFMLGTELAKELRRKGDRCKIVFLTTSKGHAIDAFSVRASDYILKPVKEERLFAIFDELLQIVDEERKTFPVKTTTGIINIRTRDVSFVELCDRRIVVNLTDGSNVSSKVIRGTFEAETKTLIEDSEFVQCQKSYVVNMEQILIMENEQLRLRSGKVIPISKRYYKQTKSKYMEYLLREEC